MHSYDYRCNHCGTRFTLTYKTYKDYDAAVPVCTSCSSTDLSRLIQKVAIQKPAHNFTKMSSGEMLGVLESGDSHQVGEMFQQIGGSSPELGMQYHETTQRLLKGESIDKVEKDLQSQQSTTNSGSTISTGSDAI
ncbi:MAG TPA: FmdB family zinc ribbon protein [Phototrophicaceae bacterium]|jgi:putative FmdB family regulatory protein|nr:FmdB family zinc ribbon protein [Phototrophicaceae bacterium]